MAKMTTNVFEIITVDDTNTGWKDTVSGYPVTARVPGYCRGFNIEYVNPEGDLSYGSCVFTRGDETINNWDLYCNVDLVRMVSNLDPTGRIVFRGYFHEEWDSDSRDTYYTDVPVDEIRDAVYVTIMDDINRY